MVRKETLFATAVTSRLREALVLAGLLLPGGCASIASTNVTETNIETDPPAVVCKFYGHHYIHQVLTPAMVNLPAKAAPITVICEAEDYHRHVAYLDTEADGWIFGNILLGGSIGILIDGASGAGQVYPERLFLPMEPLVFDSVDARDAWFGERRQEIEARWQEQIDAAVRRCEDREREISCEDSGKDLADARDEELARLEERRAAAGLADTL
ncbi:hypothetical protein [Pelagibius sp.]|uniref:hypothetical protein n=1 Tax=Pelagibius sp. TaxID=1931238 RepID=UPI00261697D1|nr:hypothetical protein [Pelagibius sp.]